MLNVVLNVAAGMLIALFVSSTIVFTGVLVDWYLSDRFRD